MVERPADYFGVDMYLKLTDLTNGRGRVHQLNGMECAIQFKSDYKAIPVNTDDAKTALYDLRQPFFICVVDKKNKKIKLFQTLGRFNSYWNDASKDVEIILENHSDGYPFDTHCIYCGDPIMTLGFENMFGEEDIDVVLKSNVKTLVKYIELENQIIVMKTLGLPASAIFENDKNDFTGKKVPGLFMENPTIEQLGLLLNCMSALGSLTGECFDLRIKNSVLVKPATADTDRVRDYMRTFAKQISNDRNTLFPSVKESLFNFYRPGESAMEESRNLQTKPPTENFRD